MKAVSGDPDPKHVSTSYVERHNLSMRMGMRRFTRLTNAFSKKIQNHAAMVAIYAVHYNFARIHKTLRLTPAMAARLSDHVWSLEEIVLMADSYMPKASKRGPYKKAIAWAVVLSIQSVRAVLWAFDDLRIGGKFAWFGVAAIYAVVAYGAWRLFGFLRNSRNSN